jgi:hypothetical protein
MILNTCILHNLKHEHLINPAAVSDFKKALRRKQTMRFSEDSSRHTQVLLAFSNQALASRKSELTIK